MNDAASRALQPDNDRVVSRCWQEWEISGRERRVVLCVETALEMRAGFAGFDPAKLDLLVRRSNGTHARQREPDRLDPHHSSALGHE